MTFSDAFFFLGTLRVSNFLCFISYFAYLGAVSIISMTMIRNRTLGNTNETTN